MRSALVEAFFADHHALLVFAALIFSATYDTLLGRVVFQAVALDIEDELYVSSGLLSCSRLFRPACTSMFLRVFFAMSTELFEILRDYRMPCE